MMSLPKTSITFLSVFAFLMVSCKNDTSTTSSQTEASKKVQENTATDQQQGGVQYLKAEFIYLSEAAVLKGDTYIYGVVLDEKAEELIAKVAPLKKNKYDMIPVEVKANIVKNPKEEGWKQLAQITQIIAVSPLNIENKDADDQISVSLKPAVQGASATHKEHEHHHEH